MIRPRIRPLMPPLTTAPRLMPVPSAKAKNGITMLGTGLSTSRHFGSRLPTTTPSRNGTSAATRAIIGISARPEAPRNSRLKKGPSLTALAT
ncbi:hypothetical protein D3C73_894260 [compost metagenome]